MFEAFLTDFHFLRPYWLLLLLPLSLLGWRLYRRQLDGGNWRAVCDPELLPHILIQSASGDGRRLNHSLAVLVGILTTVALAGPAWERQPTPVFRDQSALVVALDLSRIMDAGDLKPSRLERARFKIADLLEQRKGGLTALLTYSGEAFTVTPLTDDGGTIRAMLPALSSDLMPVQGSRADIALEQAGRLLRQAGITKGDILLISNGVDLDKTTPVARRLLGEGYRVSVLGAGTLDGAPVPLAQGGFLQDTHGNIILSKLAEPALRQIAEAGGGRYRRLAVDNTDLDALIAQFDRKTPGLQGDTERELRLDRWLDRGAWLLLPALPLAALAFRRGILVWVWLALLPLPRQADAFDWQSLWQTPNQRAARQFEAGDHENAAETFEDPRWKAAADYRAGKFEQAAEALGGQETPADHYNRGNALAKAGHYPEAIDAYKKALEQQPDFEDARYNKELVEKAMADQQQQQKDQQKQDQGSDEDSKDSKKDGESKPKEQKDGEQPKQDPSQDSQSQAQDHSEQDQGKQEDGQPQQGQDGESKPPSAEQEHARQDPADEQKAEQAQQQSPSDQPPPSEPPKQNAAGESQQRNETEQASEQWLRRIPDDPGGLLRRKFLYQYQQRREARPQ